MRKHADAVVIGAGVMGCSIAFHLAKAGLKVQVIDKKGIAGGMSARSGALIRMHYMDEHQVKLAATSLRYFQNWGDTIGGAANECGFVTTGFLYLVGPENAEKLRHNVEMHQRCGVDSRAISLEDVSELQPGIMLDGVGAVCYEPESGYADPIATNQAFAKAAQRYGAEISGGVMALGLHTKGGRIAGLETSEGFIETPVVVAAIGPWSAKLLGPAGVDLPIKPHRSQIAFFERPHALDNKLTYIDIANGLYGRRNGDGTVLAGSSSFAVPNRQRVQGQTDQWGGAYDGDYDADDGLDPDTYKESNDPEYVEHTRQILGQRFPVLEGTQYRRGHAGVYDMSSDARPLMGKTEIEGLYVAAGFSGQGFKKSPAVGLTMSQLILGETPEVDINAFRLSRFAENDPVKGEYEYD